MSVQRTEYDKPALSVLYRAEVVQTDYPTLVSQRPAGRVVVPGAGDVTTVDDEDRLADGDELWARICDWARKVWPA